MAASMALADLRRLENLYNAGFHDNFLDLALRKVIERQIARDEADLQRVENALSGYERQYGMDSDAFWGRFQAGQMADSEDFMEWNVLYKMRLRLAERLGILRGHVGRE